MHATPTGVRARGTRLRRALRALGLCVLLVLAGLTGLYLTRAVFLAPLLAARLSAELARRTGAQVTIGSLGGNGWNALELRDVLWVDGSQAAVLTRAEIGWARLEYDLRALLRGESAGLSAVSASRVRLELRSAELPAAADAPAWSLPERLPRLNLRSLSARLQRGADQLEISEADLDLEAYAGAFQPGFLRARKAGIQLADGRSGAGALTADLRWSAPRLEVASLRLGDAERARDTWIDLAHAARGDLQWGGVLSLPYGEIEHTGRLDENLLTLALDLRAVQLNAALAAVRPGADLPSALLDGRAELTLDLRHPEDLQVGFAGSLREVRWLERALDRIEGEATLARGILSVTRLQAESGRDRVLIEGLTLPVGLDGPSTLRAARGALQLELGDLPALLQGVGATQGLSGAVPPHTLSLALRLEPDQLVFEGGALTLPDGSFQVRPGQLRWGQGALDDTWIDLDLDFDFRDLASLSAILATPRLWAGSLRGALALQGTWQSLLGHVELTGEQVIAAGLPLGSLRAAADIDLSEARVLEFSSSGGLGRIEASGVWELEPRRLRDVQLSVQQVDLARLLPAVLLSGEVDFKGSFAGPLADPRGSFSIAARGLKWAAASDLDAHTLSAGGRLADARVELERCEVELGDMYLSARAAIEHQGFAPPLRVHLSEFSARRGALDLVLQEAAHADFGADSLATSEVYLKGSAGELRASLRRSGQDLRCELHGRDLDPLSLIAPFAPAGFELAGLGCDLEFERSSDGLRAKVSLEARRMRAAEGLPEMRVVARGGLEAGRAVLAELRVDAGAGRLFELSGSAPLEPWSDQPLAPGAIDLRGRLELLALQELPWSRLGLDLPLAGDLGLDLELGGAWDALTGRVDLRGESLAIVSPRNGFELFGPAHLRGRLALLPGQMRLEGLEFRSPQQAAIRADGTLAAGLRPARWLAAGIDGFLDAALDGRVTLEAADLAVLARLLPSVRRVAGEFSGALVVSGSPRAARIAGDLTLHAGELRLVGDAPTISGLEARLALDSDGLEIVHLRGEIDGGPLEVGGRIRWSGARTACDLVLRGEEVLLVQRPDLRLRADLQLSITGPLDALLVAGDLGLREGRYTRHIDFYAPEAQVRAAPPTGLALFSISDGPLADMRLDVAVRSTEPFELSNNLIDGELRCELHLGGTGRVPELVGSLFVDTTRVRLPASTLEARSGTIVFSRDDPLVPTLDVRLTTRFRSYDVVVHLQGTSLEPEIELSSTPPLSEEDLLLLILTGKTPTSAWGDPQSNAAVQNVAMFIGMDLLDGWFGGGGDGDGGESLLDRVEWRSGVDVSQTGVDTNEFTIRLSGPRSGPGRTLVLRAEQDIYDDTNFGLRVILRKK